MSHTICTFNVNNLYARYRFGQTFPGDMAGKSRVENAGFGYLPQYSNSEFELFNQSQRELAGLAISDDKKSYPDVVCLQEVESLLALRRFNEEFLDGKYEYALLVDSRDFRQIDVGVLSRLEIRGVRSHVDDRLPKSDIDKERYVFSRDCLEVDIALTKSGSKVLTLFINHLKSKLAFSPAERARADARRERQSQAVKEIVHSRFPGTEFGKGLFAVVGDLNDEPESEPVHPLVAQAGLVDALARIPKREERWTHWYRSENSVSQIDHLLLSPALDAATTGDRPRIERRGIGFSRYLSDEKPGPKLTHFHRVDNDPHPVDVDFRFARFGGVTPADAASDHCPVFFEVP